jgi:hypothetical protein
MNLNEYRKQNGQPVVGQLVYMVNNRYERWTLSRVVKVTPSGMVDVAPGYSLVDPHLAGVPKLKEGHEPKRFNAHGVLKDGRYDFTTLDFDVAGVKERIGQLKLMRDTQDLMRKMGDTANEASHGHFHKESMRTSLSELKRMIAEAEQNLGKLA